ncbi:hypothetical protein Cgig2_017632 [Carnegiea gigantea]|uniref:Uncharacterized protein n=1 Tax=Carnegiea gigantea TaxID=171969 RepID=A0A9Q1Q7L6_9CARY|nr:hypothetical protein Cgig2_017632 [Carnegiea gigantea]
MVTSSTKVEVTQDWFMFMFNFGGICLRDDAFEFSFLVNNVVDSYVIYGNHPMHLYEFTNFKHVPHIRQIFVDCDAKQILKLPLSRSWPNDTLAWHYSKDGDYSVKSSYALSYALQHNERVGSSGSTGSSSGINYGHCRFVPVLRSLGGASVIMHCLAMPILVDILIPMILTAQYMGLQPNLLSIVLFVVHWLLQRARLVGLMRSF